MQVGQTATCRSCGCKLSVLQKVRGLCDDPECRRQDVSYQQQQRRRVTLQSIHEQVPTSWRENAPIVLLPRNTNNLAPLSDFRKQSLRQHLERIVAEARESPDSALAAATETTATTNGVSASQAALPALGVACGLCGGHCCSTGGDSAWLEPGTIRRLQWHRPPVAENRIIEHYLSFVPATSYENSCVYHAEQGCCLPRAIRSNVCNQYLCKGLSEIVQGLENGEGSCIAASVVGVSPADIALIDALGILDTLNPGGEN
jgi:hypothetical protein